MNKILKFCHYLFLFTLFILVVLFIKQYAFDLNNSTYSFNYKDYLVLIIFIIYFLINIYDLIRSKRNSFECTYYFSSIIGLLSIISIIFRSVFDTSIVANTPNLTKIEKYFYPNIGKYFVSSYYIYFTSILIILFVFRFISKKNVKK